MTQRQQPCCVCWCYDCKWSMNLDTNEINCPKYPDIKHRTTDRYWNVRAEKDKQKDNNE